MARIYLSRAQTELGGERLLVIKQILPVLSSSSEFSQLLIDEAKLAARLTHGNIVQVIDLGREGSQLYIAMEYVEGFDLRELLRNCARRQVPLPLDFALLIVIETLSALDYAHRKRDDSGRLLGIVHRDVSPSNILLSFEGEVKLCDFGIARAMGAGSDLPKAAIRGKAAYMSPEAARGDRLDARSDVFAAGIILWELLSGRRLYRAEEGEAPSLERAAQAEIPELPDIGYPEQARLHAIVRRALAKERDERFASAKEMRSALEAYVGSTKLMASSLRFGEWLTTHFGQEILETRRAREILARTAARPASPPPEPRRTPAELPGPPASGARELDIPELSPPPASLAQYLPDASFAARASSAATMRMLVLVCAVLALLAFTVYLLR